MYDVNTHDVRRFFAHVWKNRLTPLQLDALQHKALRIIESHPEYTHYLENIEDYLDKNWLPEDGESNPFLHMSLHLSLQEQATIDQPPVFGQFTNNFAHVITTTGYELNMT